MTKNLSNPNFEGREHLKKNRRCNFFAPELFHFFRIMCMKIMQNVLTMWPLMIQVRLAAGLEPCDEQFPCSVSPGRYLDLMPLICGCLGGNSGNKAVKGGDRLAHILESLFKYKGSASARLLKTSKELLAHSEWRAAAASNALSSAAALIRFIFAFRLCSNERASHGIGKIKVSNEKIMLEQKCDL